MAVNARTLDDRWQFWLDVGGTFTDCVARRGDGELFRYKALSSGVVKGRFATVDSAARFSDPLRLGDPSNFWQGFQLRWLDDRGQVVDAATVAAFDAERGEFRLERPLGAVPPLGAGYELFAVEAPVLAIRWLLGLPLNEPLPPVAVRLGTTRGTNALLTRRGAATVFVTTAGFADILRIGYQNRPRLFELAIRKTEPLFADVLEIDERLAIDGTVIQPLDPTRVAEQFAALRARRPDLRAVAVCLLNGYCQPEHERLVGRIARAAGFTQISLSHEVAPFIKIVSRGDTTVVDAYLNPVLADYLAGLRQALGPAADLRLLTSAGGLVEAEAFRGRDSLLSGPAGGVVGFSRVALAAGFPRSLGFDMGGTSTDVARFDGRYEREFETEKAGVRVVAPMMAIETVAAGGGSLCRFDGIRLTVGPDSAGADPGPACYGRGGPLAVTDANVWLGRVLPDRFPFPLSRDAVARRLDEVADAMAAAGLPRSSRDELAAGFLRIANAQMAKAIRGVSLAKGCDPADYVLVAFGGAAAQHACAVAEELGIQRILSHPDASLLSAYGIGLADAERHAARGVYRDYSPNAVAALAAEFAALEAETQAALIAEGVPADAIAFRRQLDVRYRGVDLPLSIEAPPDGDYAASYAAEHRRRFGYVHADRPLEIVAARVAACAPAAAALPASHRVEAKMAGVEDRTTGRDGASSAGRNGSKRVFERSALLPGMRIAGPAIIVEPYSTTVVDAGWIASMMSAGELLLERSIASHRASDAGSADAANRSSGADGVSGDGSELADPSVASPIYLEVFNGRFMGIAEQMGITLRNTAISVNVKERLDFSCAVFDSAGDLIVNAPHMPVHLGAMSETVKRLIVDVPEINAGDVLVVNDPYAGGSHLPDVTVVTPVHDPATGRRVFFTASRAHHAEIGGVTPGSMPPFSRRLAEEGVLLRGFKLIEAGEPRFERLRSLLTAPPYPSRSVEDNLADVAAQVAANRQGARDLERLVERYGLAVVEAYMGHIKAAAERKVRLALSRFPPGRRTFTDRLDDGSPIVVAIDLKGDSATFDFTGTGPVLAGNLNANRAIVTAAVLYVLRCLLDEDVPLNQGVLAPVRIVLPVCLLNPEAGATPAESPAVVGGNVETSQRVVDVLLGALELAAASQGTMNNLLFGDGSFGYYETICGGSGATAAAAGADAVHTHMTNTRLTDPEVMERRFPVRVRQFSIRRGSGGAGQRRGGDGIRRRIEFLRPLTLSLLTERRGPYAPFGLRGGQAGELGRNRLYHGDGTVETLPAKVQRSVAAGDMIEIETPGGGGWG